MRQKFLIIAVLLCLLDVVRPTVLLELGNVLGISTEKDLDDTTTTSTLIPTTTDTSIELTTQQNTVVPQQDGNWFNHLFGQKDNGPSLIVEINDDTNDASLKIINLPVVHYRKNGTLSVSETNVTNTINSTTTTTPSYATLEAKSRRKRDVDLKIQDVSVIKAMIGALKKVNQQKADLMQDNIDHLDVSVDINNNIWHRSIQKKSELDLKQEKNSTHSSNKSRSRRSNDVKFEIYDMSVIKALIDALQKVDSAKANLLQKNIDRVGIMVEVEEYDSMKDDRNARNVPDESEADLEPRKTHTNDNNIPIYNRVLQDVKFKIYDLSVIRALISALKKNDPQRANLLQNNINRVEIKVELDDDDDWNIYQQYNWDLRRERQRNRSNSRRRRDLDFKIYDRSVIKVLIDALKKVDPQKAAFMQDNIDRIEVKVEINDDYILRDNRSFSRNSEDYQIDSRERRDRNSPINYFSPLRSVDFKIYDRSVIKALIDALRKVDPERANLMEDNLDRVEIEVDVEYYEK